MKMFAVAFNLTRSPPEKNNASANESLARSNSVDFLLHPLWLLLTGEEVEDRGAWQL